MPEWIYVAITIVIGVGIISWSLTVVLEDILKLNSIKKFSEDFKASVKHSQPSWEEIKDIASTRGLTQSDIQFTIRKFHREILAGREATLSDYKEKVKSYIDLYKEEEPFEGLPNEVRIHLERLREQIDGKEHLLEPLTSQIKDLLTIYQKEKRYQKYYTTGSFFIGLIGLGFAFYTYFGLPALNEKEPVKTTVNALEVNVTK
ncbi:MAG: hypothetical protein JXQ67_07015 [Campylobacterales bacterium]|nr:hypothetical protein [Campylobacterales bacterium]